MFQDPFMFGPLERRGYHLVFHGLTFSNIHIESERLPSISRSMIFHMAASGLFDEISIIRVTNGESLMRMNRAEQAAFVAEETSRGWKALEKSLEDGDR